MEGRLAGSWQEIEICLQTVRADSLSRPLKVSRVVYLSLDLSTEVGQTGHGERQGPKCECKAQPPLLQFSKAPRRGLAAEALLMPRPGMELLESGIPQNILFDPCSAAHASCALRCRESFLYFLQYYILNILWS